AGQVVGEPGQRQGSASPKHPVPISKQLSPNGHDPPHTPPIPSPHGASWRARFETNTSIWDSIWLSSIVVRQVPVASMRCQAALNLASALSRQAVSTSTPRALAVA